MTGRGTTNRNARGGSADRRRRRAWIMETFGRWGLVCCYRCELVMLPDEFEVDRIIPGCRGGTYARSNCRPVCGPCNLETGNAVRDGLLV